jgi:hypothetical protein
MAWLWGKDFMCAFPLLLGPGPSKRQVLDPNRVLVRIMLPEGMGLPNVVTNLKAFQPNVLTSDKENKKKKKAMPGLTLDQGAVCR